MTPTTALAIDISCPARFEMSALQSASSKSFTSTPLKTKSNVPRSMPRSRSVESTGDSTYSVLSPIYHDSFELSDDDKEEALKQCQPHDDPSLTADEGEPISPRRYILKMFLKFLQMFHIIRSTICLNLYAV